MAVEANTRELWDRVWSGDDRSSADAFEVAFEARGVRFRRLMERLRGALGDPRGKRVIEIGAGAGTYAALLADEGCDVTVLDYSSKALTRAEKRLSTRGVRARFVEADALALPSSLLGEYDVSMSFGMTEHFKGRERVAVNRAHLDVLRPGGITFVSVPNALCVPYRLYKAIAERTGRWGVGEEYPYSRWELVRLFRSVGAVDVDVFGESVWQSRHFVNPLRHSGKLRRLFGVQLPNDPDETRPEPGTPLDAWLAYAIVVSARRAG